MISLRSNTLIHLLTNTMSFLTYHDAVFQYGLHQLFWALIFSG